MRNDIRQLNSVLALVEYTGSGISTPSPNRTFNSVLSLLEYRDYGYLTQFSREVCLVEYVQTGTIDQFNSLVALVEYTGSGIATPSANRTFNSVVGLVEYRKEDYASQFGGVILLIETDTPVVMPYTPPVYIPPADNFLRFGPIAWLM